MLILILIKNLNSMKLESLESKRIANLNLIVGGGNSITDGTNSPKLDWPTMHGSKCHSLLNSKGEPIGMTCDTMTLDK